jgi:ABC-type sugar transport system permease subunit
VSTASAGTASVGAASVRKASASGGSARRHREWVLAYLMLLPALVVFGAFTFYPFLRNFKLALYQNPPFPGLPSRYVGLHQVGTVLSSTTFHQSLVSTFFYVLLVVPTGLLGGLLLALAAHKAIRGMPIFRTVFSSTVVSSVAVAAVVFGTLMDPVVGLLPWLGIDPHPAILQNPTWALPAVSLIAVWQFLGLSFIIMTAGLQSLPEEILEAARLDGAGSWTMFWRVTVPLLSPTLFFGLVVGTIYAFQSFGQIDILIGPQNAAFTHTNVLLYAVYQALSIQNDPGVAAVLSIALFVILVFFTLLQLRFLERRVTYAGA